MTPPLTPESAAELGDLQKCERFELDLDEMSQVADISISGLGWISVGALASLRKEPGSEGMRTVIDVWVPVRVRISLRPPMPIAGLPNEPPPPPEDNWKDFTWRDGAQTQQQQGRDPRRGTRYEFDDAFD